jgi:5-methylcytosine-specific restriction endonuclease McrA
MTSKEKTAYRTTKHWKQRRLLTLERDDYHCRLCGRSIKKGGNVHHLDDSRPYDEDSIDNLVSLCKGCHRHVAHKHFKEELQQTINIMLRNMLTDVN